MRKFSGVHSRFSSLSVLTPREHGSQFRIQCSKWRNRGNYKFVQNFIPLGTPRRKWEDDIKKDIKEIRFESVD
jgi:hypothetical protein